MRIDGEEAGAVSGPGNATSYRRLSAAAVHATANQLAHRIGERFPGRGIEQVAAEVVVAADEAMVEAPAAAAPILWLRLLTGVVGASLLAALVWAGIGLLRLPAGEFDRLEVVGATEAVVNEVLLLGAAAAFLVTVERRVKRRRVLAHLSELRSLAHVVDMHQMAKDPDRSRGALPPTESSPESDLSLPLLTRYLDYCSELLAMIGKVAALYAQDLDDDTVLEVVGEVEGLCAAISRTIWQKITIIGAIQAMERP